MPTDLIGHHPQRAMHRTGPGADLSANNDVLSVALSELSRARVEVDRFGNGFEVLATGSSL